jgi:hypothetical protein
VTGGRAGQSREGARGLLGVDPHRRALAGRAGRRQLERVHLAQHRVVAATLDPRGEREQVEQLDELVRGARDQLDVAAHLLRVQLLEPRERLREPMHGRERGAQVVARERDQPGEVGAHDGASVTA